MPPRQRSKSPATAPVISGDRLSGTPGSTEASPQARDIAAVRSTVDTTPFEETNTGSLDRDATPNATFVGEQLEYKDRHTRISEAAYRRAEERGFAPGHELEDWLAAEQEIDALLGPASAQDAR